MQSPLSAAVAERRAYAARVHPLRGPVFDLDDPNARGANGDDVDFIGLELMGDRESEIR